MLDLFDYHEQVAVDAAVGGRVASAAKGEGHAVLYTCGDLERHSLLLAHDALAVAVCAALGDGLAIAFALGAQRLALNGAEGCLLHAVDDAGAVTGVTGGEGHAVFGTRALAVLAGDKGGDFEGLGGAGGNLLQRHLHAYAQVAAATLPWLPASAARASAAHAGCSAEAAEASAAEDVAELGEDVLHREAARAEAAKAAAGEALGTHVVAELVIFLTFLRVGEDVVSLRRLLEFLLGGLVAGVAVGMVFEGKLAVGLLQVVGADVFVNAKDLVVISFGVSHLSCVKNIS